MEKRQLPDGPNARQRIYLIGRLRKAVKWATLFSQLCAIKGDSRTSLEAEVLFKLQFNFQTLNPGGFFGGGEEISKCHA